MVEVTQEDRAAAATLARQIDERDIADNILAGTRDPYAWCQAFAAHRIATEQRIVDGIVAWLRTDARLCDCFARSEGECVCGARSDYKTKPVDQTADAIQRGEWKEG